MKTNDLITMLANQAGPAPLHLAAKNLWPAGAAGLLVATLLALVCWGFIPLEIWNKNGPWIKLAYAGTLTVAAGWLISRLGKPAASARSSLWAVLLIASCMGMLGLFAYLDTPDSTRHTALMGHSWLACPWNILLLSVPAMACAFRAMRSLAPTQKILSGGACGLFAGAIGAMGYAFSCTEIATPFIAVWYSAGIALSSLLGALLGPKLLNW